MSTVKKLNMFSLTLLITGAIDSIRNLPTAALFGSKLIFFFIFAALFFLLPTALISAELTANIDEGGIYQWCKLAFGESIGFLAIWLQWINNIVWFPTILSFIAGTAAYLIDPHLAQNKFYLVAVILSSFWFLTLINLKGIHFFSSIASFCAIAGLLIPVALIIGLLFAWLLLGYPSQIHLSFSTILPRLNHIDYWMALTGIMLGFAGIELATVHIKDVDQPQKIFPLALGCSTIIILITMMLGSLAIAVVLPYNQINLVNGTMQTFAYLLSSFHLSGLIPILTVLLIIGSFGSMISWGISPLKGLSQAAQHGFLPSCFTIHNAHDAPTYLLLIQAILVSFSCFAFLFLPSVNGSYWLLTALTTQLYILMYVLMFLSALYLHIKMRKSSTHQCKPFSIIPGKHYGVWFISIIGLIGCGITLFVGFIPPQHVNIGSNFLYECLFCGGIIVLLFPAYLCCLYRKKYSKIPLIKKEPLI